MRSLLLATRNSHKTHEFAEILGHDFKLHDLTSAPEFPPVEESGRTFEENAILKALAASQRVPGLVVADDSGLEVAALAGEPGVYSARYAGEDATDPENIAKLLLALRAADPNGKNHAARFCCVLALVRSGEVLSTFHGEITGTIISEPRGKNGFGYDPVFVPLSLAQTFAEVGLEQKNRISHRAAAIQKLREYLRSSLEPQSYA